GVNVTDALRITEEYDPATNQWTRLPDLNSERHGTQAIVSGDGIFILAGSPKIGGGPNGNQKNMEYYGVDAPVGSPSTASTLSAPSSLAIPIGNTRSIALNVDTGTVGIVVGSMEITGPNSDDFNIVSGEVSNGFLKPNSAHTLFIEYTGTEENINALLTINYNTSSLLEINLSSIAAPTSSIGFTLVNADSDEDLFDLFDGDQIAMSVIQGLGLNIRANTDPEVVGSVFIQLTGPVSKKKTESVEPYALFGDSNGNYAPATLLEGDYNLTATTYNGPGKTGGILSGPETIQFSIVDQTGGGNQPPMAIATSSVSTGDAPLSVNFTGSDSTDDIGVTSYSWDFKDGNTSTIENPTNLFTDPGTYDVELTVMDEEGLSSTAIVTITVNGIPGNAPPEAVASASVSGGTAPLEVDFTGSGSTDDIGVTSYFWDFKDGNTANTPDPTHTFINDGIYNVELTVTDEAGLSDTVSLQITVGNAILEGVASVTLINADTNEDLFDLFEGQQIDRSILDGIGLNIRANTLPTLVGSVFLQLTGPLSKNRTEGTAPYALFGDSGGNYVSADFPQGDYSITATAYNGPKKTGGVLGQPLTIQFSIVEPSGGGNLPPIAIASASPDTGNLPLEVDFTGSISIDDVGIASYFWDFKDGSTSNIEDPTHTFTNPGVYEVELIVTDAEGLFDSTTTTITVNNTSGNVSPNVENPGTQNSDEGDPVSLQIQATDDGSLTYAASGLPPGLDINDNTGLITGTISAFQSGDGAFLESNGLVIIEAESGDIEPTWSETNIGGTTGIIAGTNSFTTQNRGTVPYQITITNPGIYRINWRSLFTGDKPSERNDNWLRFPNNDDVWFYGQQMAGSNEANIISNLQGIQDKVVFPKGSSRITPATTPNGAGSNGYFKVFRSGQPAEEYKWQAVTSDGNGHRLFVWFVNPGTYTMEISERSAGHAIDKVALYRVAGPSYTDEELTAAPESARSGTSGSSGAAANSPYNVLVTVADDGIPSLSSSVQFDWVIGGGETPTGSVPWVEDFSGLNNGATFDNGSTAWTSNRDAGVFEVDNGAFKTSSNSSSPGVWTSEVIDITNAEVSVSVDVNDEDDNKESADFIRAFYKVNGGPLVQFGLATGNISPQAFTANNIIGNTIQIIVEADVSFGNEVYLFDNISVVNSGSSSKQNSEGDQLSGLDSNSEELISSWSMELFPNPTSSRTQILIKDEADTISEIFIYDVTGRLVKVYDGSETKIENGLYELNLNGMEEGIYFLKTWLKNDSKPINSKLILKR
ncbi:MAG: PKD domain-containing protein, partial [Saonia sp.]